MLVIEFPAPSCSHLFHSDNLGRFTPVRYQVGHLNLGSAFSLLLGRFRLHVILILPAHLQVKHHAATHTLRLMLVRTGIQLSFKLQFKQVLCSHLVNLVNLPYLLSFL